jgi:hypothetical protein
MYAERGWDVWVRAGQDGFIVQEEGEVVGGECEVEDEGAGELRCDLVALVPLQPSPDQYQSKRENDTKVLAGET